MTIGTTDLAGAAKTGGPGPGFSPRLVLRLALRELRAGLGGFHVFIACVALGVLVITAVGALSDALRHGLARQGEEILGGDVVLSRSHTRGTDAERGWLAARGRVSEAAMLRTMARRTDDSEQTLVELKAVDGAYPLVGAVRLGDGAALQGVLAESGAVAVEPMLLERLGVKLGDRIGIGRTQAIVRAVIEKEPDGIADRLTYGPRILMSQATLEASGLVTPGTLVRWRYALRLGDGKGADDAALLAFRDSLKRELPEAGFVIADRRDPSPQVTRTIERLRQFLTLIGLTALLVGGVGVANAVSTFIDRRRRVIGTMKSLGASNATVTGVFLTQVMLMALIGVAIGVTLGAVVPVVISRLWGDALPVRAEIGVSLTSLSTAALYGFLVALLFALWPLGRASQVGPTVLFRDEVAEETARPPVRIMVVMALIAAALVAFAVLTSDSRRIALWFCLALVVVFGAFIALGSVVTRAARRMPRPRTPELAVALGNVAAPGGLTRSVVLSLGAGLSLLTAVALADASLIAELKGRIPAQSPSYFVLDLGRDDLAGLTAIVHREAPAAEIGSAPMLRGRLVRLKETAVEDLKVAPEAQWVLAGDRGLTYADTVPEGSRLVAGTWWAKGYDGEPLVSFEAELARKLGVGIGDMVTVNVLGRNVSARIANLREVNWESLAINFVMVFSPNVLAGAPHNLIATITLPKAAGLDTEARIAKAIGRAYPGVTAIRVKDALNAFAAIYAKIMLAVRVAGSVTLLAGALVLAGSLATAQRRRIVEAVILKTLGATRRRILLAHAAEYLGLAAVTAGLAVALGTLSAWVALTRAMDLGFTFSWVAVAQALGLAIGLVLMFGAFGTWRVLAARPVPYLRNE